MKQVFVDGKGEIHVLEVPAPAMLRDGILVRTLSSLISQGTEAAAVSDRGGLLGLYEKATHSRARVRQVLEMATQVGLAATRQAVMSKVQDFTPLGYSSAGVVEEVDDQESGFVKGDLVATMGVGFATHSELATVPSQLAVKLPPRVPVREAAFGAVACIAMQGIRRLDLSPGESVAVVGLGLIGQLAVQIASALGYRVLATDLSAEKAKLARDCGALDAWAASDGDAQARVAHWTEGGGVDGVVICAASASSEVLNNAFDLCRQRGRVSVVGDIGLAAERAKMYRKELEMRMSTSYGPGRYDAEYELEGKDYPIAYARWTERRNLSLYLDLIARGKLQIAKLVTREFPIADAEAAYKAIKAGGNQLGVLFSYAADTGGAIAAPTSSRISEQVVHYRPPAMQSRKGDRIRIGVIGCGGFTKAVHLPNLRALGDEFSVDGVASRSGATAGAVASRTGARIATSDYRAILDDKNIDAVLVATRHSSHGQIAADALKAGKHVFVEKPLAITVEDCDEIRRAALDANLVVRVGFNRRFAPLYQRARELLSRSEQRMLLYRVNVGDVVHHWSAEAEEGGRLLGEGCHFFDLFNWFYGAAPVSSTASIAGARSTGNANVFFTATYPCGSVASLLYTTAGSRRMPKERLEAFGAGLSLACTDFRRLEVFGGADSTRGSKDKGHRGVLVDFARAIRGDAITDAGADAKAGLLATAMALSVYDASVSPSGVVQAGH